jgi:hypothetical protein
MQCEKRVVDMVEGQRRGTSQEEHIGGIGIGAPAEGDKDEGGARSFNLFAVHCYY